jgi:uncharacterized protein (DUF362 family)
MDDLTRRDFLKFVGTTALASQFSFLTGCSKARTNISYSDLLAEAKQLHRSLSVFPADPVAIAWNPAVRDYPPLRNAAMWFREKSEVYPLVEKAMMLLNKETPQNPFSKIIRKGDTVVIKPNWGTQYLFPTPVTHPSVVVPVVEYAVKAGAIKIILIEGPMTLYRSQKYFWGPAFLNVPFLLEELRRRHPGVEFRFQDANDDQFVWVELGDASTFHGVYDVPQLDHDGHTGFTRDIFFRAADSNGYVPGTYKLGIYAIAKSYLEGDVFIGIPKLKTHGWSGITAALKNLMGMNLRTTSHFLSPQSMMEYQKLPDFSTYRESPLRDVPHYSRASWDGKGFVNRKLIGYENDVLWRSLSDLNKLIRYADKNGKVQKTYQRRYAVVVDAIIGTDRGGPVSPSTVETNAIVAGFDPVAVDGACLRLMNWNYRFVRLVQNIDRLQTYRVGTLNDLDGRIVGVDRKSAAFSKYYIPPANFSDEVLSPHTLKI